MHLHGNANDDFRKNARCIAAMQIGDNTAVILRCSPRDARASRASASLEG
jgi:hypothetical protein